MTMFKTITLISLLFVVHACSKSTQMQEAEKTSSIKQAPPECLSTFREFFAYIKKSTPSIIEDQTAQNRWLTKNLREALTKNVARFGKETNVPDFPTNQTFLGVWNNPTTYSLVGSRHYDYHDTKNPNGNQVIIDVLYVWDNSGSLDNQYPGQKSLMSFVFVFEEDTWKLDDIYTFTDTYASAQSLNAYWRRD